MRILGLDRTPKGLRAQVMVHNVGAGHSVPTGIPTRKVILTLQVADRGPEIRGQANIRARDPGPGGKELRRDSDVFLEGKTAKTDTRLAPLEERIEEFFLPVPAEGNAQVTATLTYLYSPHDRKETETRIDFWKEKRELSTNWRAGR